MMVSTDRALALDNQEEKHPIISRCAHTKKSAWVQFCKWNIYLLFCVFIKVKESVV